VGLQGWREAISEFLRPKDIKSNLAHNLFVTGSVAVFALLTIWNGFALILRIRSRPSNHPTIPDFVHEWITTTRIGIFVLISIICFCYWLFVSWNSPWVSSWALAWIVFYAIMVVLILALRYDTSLNRVERAFVRLCETIRKIDSKSKSPPSHTPESPGA